MAAEVDYSRSTNEFPMEAKPVPVVVDQGIDYSKSTGEYPMYDDRNARELRVAHLEATLNPTFVTPGPVSVGHPDLVTEQRKALGLSNDPSGESDTDYEARPSTVPVVGADGVDRVFRGGYLIEAEALDDGSEKDESDKSDEDESEPETKVVKPPAPRKPRGRTRASGK